MKNFSDFTGLFSLSKTLRFELKPIGKTLENIEKKGLLDEDEKRAENYKKVKKLIDEYHKNFIENALSNLTEKEKDGLKKLLDEYFEYYNGNQKDELVTCATDLRKHIADVFKNENNKETFKRIFGKELIREDLIKAVKSDDERKLIGEFNDFTTYFTGFHENRKNIYSAEEKSTAIAYRLINENLPKFIDNMKIFEKITQIDEIRSKIEELQKNLSNELNGRKVADFFEIAFYGSLLTQSQIEIYNDIVGGLNQYTNLYNHQQSEKKDRLPKFKPLFKQILSDRNAISWLPDEFENDNDMLQSIEKCYQDLKEQVFGALKLLLINIKDYDLEHIYLPNDSQLTDIAQKHFGSWSVIRNAVVEDLKASNPQKRKEDAEDYEKRMEKLHDSYSIAYLNGIMQGNVENFKPIEDYFVVMGAEDNDNGQKLNHFARIENAYTEIKTLFNTTYPEGKNLSQDKANVEKIKNLLDTIKDLQHFVKPLLGSGTESEKDNRFYGDFAPLWETLDKITPLYNMVRNRMTKKPYSDEKIRLYFDNKGLFLNGWVDSKTDISDNGTQYGGYLFRKINSIGEYDYYLGVSASTTLFRSFNSVEEGDKSILERLDYYQLKGKTFYGSLYKGDYEEETSNIRQAIDNVVFQSGSEQLKESVDAERQKKHPKISTAIGYLKFISQTDHQFYELLLNDSEFKKSNQKIMTSMKSTLLALDRIPAAKELAQKDFTLFSEMMENIDIMLQGKVFSYFPVSQKELDETISRANKPLYLFKIINKDLSFAENHEKRLRKSRGRENLHTMYFRTLMSGNQNVFDIGSGSVYFRKQKIFYTEEQLKKGHHYEMLKDKFDYPIISNKRYAFDKFQFHLSVNINYNAEKNKDINSLVKAYLKESNATHIIGIDRGERHLLYLSLIDLQGNIVEQYSLNEIVNEYNGNTYRTNYHNLLDAKEKQRDEARRSWQTIENIKELKEGYMSQVVHKIAELMVKYKAIVVLEDLNPGFMRGRQKVEKQVYQKFEKMLIDKLNYLVDKKLDAGATGGVLNAYQLTNKFESFQKMGKQSGFLFYIPAWNTSKMDPTTGFVNLFDTRYENMEKAKVFFGKFDSIRLNSDKGWFELAFDYNNFTTKAEGTQTKWTLCTYGTRIETKPNPEKNNKFDSVEFDLTERIKELFAKYKLDLNGNLKEQICNQTDAAFFKELLHLLHLTLQMRNSITGTKTDYLISPVMNAKGEFYDSRVCGHNLPENADANGAYNIARKGLWVVEQIKHADDLTKIKLAISNKEWLRYAQGLD